ncbi:MAG: hypothetical protein KC621_19890 [Myxococcales bacterium]|nr:hypothetical protein [Myxococcales bacterium]
MPLSPAIQTLIDAFAPTAGPTVLEGTGASDELVAVAAASRVSASPHWVNLGRWEIAVGGEELAREHLERSNATGVRDAHAHWLALANEGGCNAVVGWNPGEREQVFVVDEEVEGARSGGTLAAWSVHQAIGAEGPLASALRRVTTERVTTAPPHPSKWSPEPDVAAQLKGGGHEGWAIVGGCPVSIHKTGIRALIGGKKKSKGMHQGNSHRYDVSGDAVWKLAGNDQVVRATLPGLELSTVAVGGRPWLVSALSSTHAAVVDHAVIVVVGFVDGELVVVDRYPTGFSGEVFQQGSRTGWLTIGRSQDARTQLWRWDGVALRVHGGWAGNGTGVTDVDGVLYGQRYEGSWVDVKMST